MPFCSGGFLTAATLVPGDLPMPADELRAETEVRIAQSNIQGRALAEAFLRQASV